MSDSLDLLGARAATEFHDGDLIGLGSGSTAEAMIRALGTRVAAGLAITGVPTSDRTASLATSLNIPLASLDGVDRLDICIDGADEIDPHVNVVKGRGGALLYEKLVALQADRYIIIASAEKLVEQLGTRLPVPVEIVPIGWQHTLARLSGLGLEPTLRMANEQQPYSTDGGHYILDCQTEPIDDAEGLAAKIKDTTGVVDHGLFLNMADTALTIDQTGEITEHAR